MDTGRSLYGGSNPPLTLIGAVAQLVEHLPEEQGVGGSNPPRTTNGVKGLNDDSVLLSEILVKRHDK
jgi:hypothetical protein